MTERPINRLRGFACISVERRREIASMGGKSVPKEKRSYSIDRDLASSSGKKGGAAVAPANRGVPADG